MYPSGITVPTPLGDFRIAVTDGQHVYACGLIVIRQIEYKYEAHFFLKADGTFGTKDSDRIYMRRTDSVWKNEASAAAEKKANEVVLPALRKWCDEEYKTGTAFWYAEQARAAREDESRRNEIEKLRAQIAKLEREIGQTRLPVPPNNCQIPLTAADFEGYKTAFVEEWKRAACTDKCFKTDEEIRQQFDATPDVREAVRWLLRQEEFVNAGFDAARSGAPRTANPFSDTGKCFELWNKGWDDYEQIRPMLGK
jgi:hypothetical protein